MRTIPFHGTIPLNPLDVHNRNNPSAQRLGGRCVIYVVRVVTCTTLYCFYRAAVSFVVLFFSVGHTKNDGWTRSSV